MPCIEIERASKRYGANHVLCDINLDIEAGEFVAIVGFSGAGKTTLINLIAGLTQPDVGEVRFKGRPIIGPSAERGLVFQNYSLLPWLTVFDNVMLAVEQVFPEWSPKRRAAHVEKYVAMVNLTAARNKLPRELSGGMRQRVAVARALAMNPEVLLLDEPLSALDALTRATLQDEIARLSQEDQKTIILITNDPDEALLLADRVIPLTAGPGATLGSSFHVTIPRPRDRKTIAEEDEFRRIKQELVDYLLRSKQRQSTKLERKLVLPEIMPEDLSIPRPMIPWFGGRGPIRKHEIKTATVEVPR